MGDKVVGGGRTHGNSRSTHTGKMGGREGSWDRKNTGTKAEGTWLVERMVQTVNRNC